jgi:hypothetical protein
MGAVAAPKIQAQRHRESTVDLATTKSLKRTLEKDFSAAVSPISVLETFCEHQPVGIVVAGGIATIDKVKVGVSYVCPLGPIMTEWGLKLS